MIIDDIKNKILSYQNTQFFVECIECGKKIEWNEIGRPVKYCNECALKVITIQKRRSKKRIGRYKVGTTEMGSHFCGDFEKELRVITRELSRLGLR